jgi:hypothetical protein
VQFGSNNSSYQRFYFRLENFCGGLAYKANYFCESHKIVLSSVAQPIK